MRWPFAAMLFVAPCLAAQTGRDTAHAATQKIAIDSIQNSVIPATNRYCKTGAVGYMKTACPILVRQTRALVVAESLLIASTSPIVPVDTTHPLPIDTAFHVFAANDFESGTIAPFIDQWAGQYPPEWLAAVPDPTGSGRGKVLQIRYVNFPESLPVPNYDNNHGINLPTNYPNSEISYGDEVIFTGDLYIARGPTDSVLLADGLRKFNYWCSSDTDWSVSATTKQNHFCFIMTTQANGHGSVGTSQSIEWVVDLFATQPGSTVTLPLQFHYTGVPLTENAWHRVTIDVKINSSPAVRDGRLRITLDSTTVENRSDIWYVDPSWGATQKLQLYDWRVGYQVNSSSKVDETRYWDNLRFSVKRKP